MASKAIAGRLACAAALLALLALALAWSLQPLVHDDLFWHLRTGEWIATHHRVPLADLFSYTRFGARWITHEWGFSLASWLVWRAAGAGGLVGMTVLLALAIFTAVGWRAVELADGAAAPGGAPGQDPVPGGEPGEQGKSGGVLASGGAPMPGAAIMPGAVPGGASATSRCLLLAALLGLGLWAASPEIFLRAALAGELMLALALAALARYRRTGRRRWLGTTAALFWPWANLHSGVVFGLYLLVLHALAPLMARRTRREAAPYLWTLAAALALTLLNPNGLDAPLYPFLLARILFASGIPWELGHFSAGAPTGGANAALWLLVVVLLLALLPVRSLRQAGRLPPAEAAAIASFLLLTLASHRFVFDLVVIAVPTLYRLLVWRPDPAPRAVTAGTIGLAGRPRLAAGLVALFLLPVGGIAVAGTAAGWARRPPSAGGLIAEALPQAAARFLAAEGIARAGDRLFNHQNWGGFLGWRLRVPVFWDGRNDVFAELVREVATQPFGLTARRYRLDYLVLAEHDLPGIQPEIAGGAWGLVYWDDFCAAYLRRGARYAAQLGRLELRRFPPFGGPYGGGPGLAALAADPRAAAAARAELAQLLAANPANQRARYFAGMISLYRGELRRGAGELLAASRIRPNDQVELVLGWLRQHPAAPAPAGHR